MDKRTLHYKKVIDTYTVTKYEKYNDATYPEKVFRRLGGNNQKFGYWKPIDDNKTVDEDTFQRYYGDTTKSVCSQKITIVIEEYPNKVSCKLYSTERNRRVGSLFFRVRKTLTYLTYNFKHNNFYSGTISKKNKKIISKKVRVNDFRNHPFSSLNLEIRRHLRDSVLHSNHQTRNKSKSSSTSLSVDLNQTLGRTWWGDSKLDTNDAGDFSNDIMNIFLNTIKKRCDVKTDIKGKDYEVKFFQLYMETNSFKYPNNYREYAHLSIPKKLLRKNLNLVSLFMEVNGLKGRKARKLLNVGYNLDFEVLIQVHNLLGVDYFSKLNDSVFVKNNMNFSSDFKVKGVDLVISNLNKQKVVETLNNGLRLHLILEHFNMVLQLEDIHNHIFKVKFKDIEEFNEEHYNLSELLQSYKKGEVTRFYGNKFIDKIENTITDLVGVEYYPKLLLTTNHYNEESQIQKNCVRTYIEKPNNIIISLRVGDVESKLRATLEYRFIKNKLVRTQSLGGKNSGLTNMWGTPLEILDDRVKSLFNLGLIKIPQLTKQYRSGNIIKRKSFYSGDMLIWDNDNEMDMITEIDLPF